MKRIVLSIIVLSSNILISRPPSLNTGIWNTCYLNATLQSLYSLKPFVNILQNKTSLFKPNTFAEGYTELITNFKNPNTINPKTSISYLNSFAKKNDEVIQHAAMCGAAAQNDSQEFLTILLNELQNKNSFITPEKEEESILLALLESLFSYIRSRFKCPSTPSLPEVNRTSSIHEFSPIISVEIPHQDKPIIFEELLATFFLPEQLETFRSYPQYSCTKQLELVFPPEILIIHTKRLQHGFKINTPIEVPEILNLLPITNHNEEYQLTAVIVHHGGAGGGHYVAYVRDSEDLQWYYCSDTTINLRGHFSTIPEIEQGYMFFYQKIKPGQTPQTQPDPLKKALTDFATELNNLRKKIP